MEQPGQTKTEDQIFKDSQYAQIHHERIGGGAEHKLENDAKVLTLTGEDVASQFKFSDVQKLTSTIKIDGTKQVQLEGQVKNAVYIQIVSYPNDECDMFATIASVSLVLRDQILSTVSGGKIQKEYPFKIDISKQIVFIRLLVDRVKGEVGFVINGEIIGELFQHDSFKGQHVYVAQSIKTSKISSTCLSLEDCPYNQIKNQSPEKKEYQQAPEEQKKPQEETVVGKKPQEKVSDEVTEFLTEIDQLTEYEKFAQEKVTTLNMILMMSIDDLKEIGIPMGPRKMISNHIQKINDGAQNKPNPDGILGATQGNSIAGSFGLTGSQTKYGSNQK